MTTKITKKIEQHAKIIKSLAHPTRLFIVEELSKGERCVCELTEMTGFDISTISKHLSILKEACIVDASKRGLQIFYSLKTPCILKFLSCIENVVKINREEHALV